MTSAEFPICRRRWRRPFQSPVFDPSSARGKQRNVQQAAQSQADFLGWPSGGPGMRRSEGRGSDQERSWQRCSVRTPWRIQRSGERSRANISPTEGSVLQALGGGREQNLPWGRESLRSVPRRTQHQGVPGRAGLGWARRSRGQRAPAHGPWPTPPPIGGRDWGTRHRLLAEQAP